MKKKRICCSGPLFCAEEVGGMSAIAKVLEDAGFQTFLPHRKCAESNFIWEEYFIGYGELAGKHREEAVVGRSAQSGNC